MAELIDAAKRIVEGNSGALRHLSTLTHESVNEASRENARRLVEAIAAIEAALLDMLSGSDRQTLHDFHSSHARLEESQLTSVTKLIGLKEITTAQGRKCFGAPNGAVVGPSYGVGLNVKVVRCCIDDSYVGLAPTLEGWGCSDGVNAEGCPPYTLTDKAG